MELLPDWPAPRSWAPGDAADAFATFGAYRVAGAGHVGELRPRSIADATLAATTTLFEVLHQVPLDGAPRRRLEDAVAALRDGRGADPAVHVAAAFDVSQDEFVRAFTAAAAAPARPVRTLAKLKSDLRFWTANDDLDGARIGAALTWLDRLMGLRHGYQLPGTMAAAITALVDGARGQPHRQVRHRVEDLVDRILHSRAATWQ